VSIPHKQDRALLTIPTFVVSIIQSGYQASTYSSALYRIESIHVYIQFYISSDYFFNQVLTSLLTFTSSSDKKIIPIQDTVAGDANFKLSVSNMKFTLSPNEILSPFGSVKR
jgi:hypothetical protein